MAYGWRMTKNAIVGEKSRWMMPIISAHAMCVKRRQVKLYRFSPAAGAVGPRFDVGAFDSHTPALANNSTLANFTPGAPSPKPVEG